MYSQKNDVIEQRFKEARFLNVSALNRYLNNKFEMDIHLQEVFLQGEISNFKKSGKHFYFSIKDEFSEISAMMFYPDNSSLTFNPKDGSLVQVMGKVQIYLKRGTYSIVVKKMVEQGIGILYQQFLALKEKLSNEGLFDVSIKLPLPKFPKNIAIITAPTGDAIHDIISTFNNRLPFAKLTLYPALVQGEDAPLDLMRALKEVYQNGNYDALIIGRGGGSFEDLSCFNDERLARLLFASTIPTVTGIGHESDFTICDFVSSYRAPTPTAAAIILTKDRLELLNNINHLTERLIKNEKILINNFYYQWQKLATSYLMVNFSRYLTSITNSYQQYHERLVASSPLKKMFDQNDLLNHLTKRLYQVSIHSIQKHVMLVKTIEGRLRQELITERLLQNRTKLDNLTKRIKQAFINKINDVEQRVNYITEKMVILNPFNLMKKGYSIVYQNDCIITNIDQLTLEQPIDIKIVDGTLKANIIKVKKEINNG